MTKQEFEDEMNSRSYCFIDENGDPARAVYLEDLSSLYDQLTAENLAQRRRDFEAGWKHGLCDEETGEFLESSWNDYIQRIGHD